MSPLTSAARRLEAAEELPTGANGAPTVAAAAAWRVDLLRPSREVKIRARLREKTTQRKSHVTGAEPAEPDYRAQALAMWPRLDHDKLRRTRGDVMRIARLVERRTACSLETIIGMLTRDDRARG